MLGFYLTHWGRAPQICVSKLTIIGSNNGLPPDRRQAIIWTNAQLLLIGPLGINFSEILIEILTFSFKKMRLKVSSAKRRTFCLGLDVVTHVCKNGPCAWTYLQVVVLGRQPRVGFGQSHLVVGDNTQLLRQSFQQPRLEME